MAIGPIPNKHVDIRHYTMKSGETFPAGNAVKLDSTGTVVTSGDDPSTDSILGFALSGYGGGLEVDPYAGDIPVAVAKSNSTFIMEASGNLATTNIGEDYGIVNTSTTTGATVDLTDTTNKCVTIEAIISDQDDAAGVPNLVEVSIHLDTLQLGGV